MQRKYTCLKRFCSRSGRVDDEATYSICLKIVHGGTKNRQSVGQEEQYYRGDSQFLSGCSALLYILSALVDICWPCTVQLLRMQKIYSQSERSNLINQEWHVVVHYVLTGQNVEFPFFFMTSSLHLLRSQLMELQFAQVKNLSTKPLDVSLPPFHTGATRLESSAYFWDRAYLYTAFASLKSVYFNLAYLQTSFGVRLSRIHFSLCGGEMNA